ncbi:FUSC family protein [Streptomyces sp. NPDC096013]|uniref:FUSC family protein n=1 Tax=Streptomyces sp. NPDC096013 TaxID=3366069 RepID=UPI00380EAA15
MRRTLRFDPGLWYLRATAVGVATMLGTYGWSLYIEHEAGLHVDSVVQAVVISAAFSRVQRAFDRTDRLVACVVLPCAAAGGTELSSLIQHHPDLGDALFILGMAGSVWIRRFGLRATRAGTLLVLPLTAVLVVPGGIAAGGGHERTGWAAVTALFAVVWGTLVTWAAQRTGLVRRPPSAAVVTTAGPARTGIPASTRMALQLAVALAAAFVVGRSQWPDHWAWTVLTAFLVCSGARSRGDVLVKGAWRTLGASVGTMVAGAVAGSFGPRSDTAVVVIFSVLAVATWLRELSYAFWAACVTAVLSLLYDWFGQSSGDLLHTRLAGIAVGAALGLAASWLVLPIRTSAVTRARTATALAALGELLEADWHDARAVRAARGRFIHRVEQLGLATKPLKLLAALPVPHARLMGWQPDRGPLRVLAALRRCTGPVDRLVVAAAAPDVPADDPRVARSRTKTAAHTLALRRAIGRRPAPAQVPSQPTPPTAVSPAGPQTETVRSALLALSEIDAELDVLTGEFGLPPTALPTVPATDSAVPVSVRPSNV